ncbi:hypothetical protein [Pseudorhizobium endolithicum]|uniref:hypothetical protein n=1 Tax=Pseudorhizobium endolithicum TaxID=1191678 RepID=UPI001158172A|nr:hypothetical protein [Pseudorhizobium endolithicum]
MPEGTAPIQVSVKAPTDQLDLSEHDAKMYAALGVFTARCASLEHIVDKFLFCYGNTRTPLVCRTTNFPATMEAKVDFIVSAYIEDRRLRSCGDADDRLDLNAIGYLMDEVWDARKHLIHGSLYFSRHDGTDFSFTSSRYTRVSKNRYEVVSFRISRGAILRLLDNIAYLKAVLRVALDILDGGDPKTQYDEIRKGRLQFRELRQALLEDGREVDPTGIIRFFAGEAT